jgi:uncharacterized protein
MDRNSAAIAMCASVACAMLASSQSVVAAGQSLDCAKAAGTIDEIVCQDPKLAALDRKLVDVYAAASKVATSEQRNRLAAEQQQWLEDVKRCTGAPNRAACATERYTQRIADLQAQFKLVASRGPYRFVCNGSPGDVLVAQYFETDPPAGRFTHAGRTVTAYVQRSGSGARYGGPNISYWEHQGEASVVWFGRSMKCAAR